MRMIVSFLMRVDLCDTRNGRGRGDFQKRGRGNRSFLVRGGIIDQEFAEQLIQDNRSLR